MLSKAPARFPGGVELVAWSFRSENRWFGSGLTNDISDKIVGGATELDSGGDHGDDDYTDVGLKAAKRVAKADR